MKFIMIKKERKKGTLFVCIVISTPTSLPPFSFCYELQFRKEHTRAAENLSAIDQEVL